MAANHFKIKGEQINSLSEFLEREQDGEWKGLLYFPESFRSVGRSPLVFSEKTFVEISFKDTDIEHVRFVRCRFERCLFIGASITRCEFTDCIFIETNTSKLKINQCLLDPACFDKNFDLVNDTNIAIDLYHSLYRNASDEHQPDHGVESLYRMKRAENRHLDSQKLRGIITPRDYFKKKCVHVIYDFISGYGLRTTRVLRFVLIVIALFSVLNYSLSPVIFKSGLNVSFIDSIYFTCVTMTTLGYGDITPATPVGKILVTLQALSGFIVMSILIAAITKKTLKAT
jgi:hypothetical protein